MLATAPPADELTRPPDDVPERLLGEDGARAYRRFLEWNAGERFALCVIEIKTPVRRDALVAWTLAQLSRACVVRLDETGGKSINALLARICPKPAEASALLLTNLEEVEDRRRLCAQMNVQRDELVEIFQRPWVILAHPSAAMDLRMLAPDFSDFAVLWLREQPAEADALARSTTLGTLARAAVSMVESSAPEPSDLLTQAGRALAFGHTDEAHDLLARYDFQNPEGLSQDPRRIRLAGRVAWLDGESDKALALYAEALKLADDSRDAHARVVLVQDIARVKHEAGDWDGALALHEESLRTFERLGDRYGRALSLHEIARIRHDRGDWEAALALYTEALKTYEELGARDACAVVLGDMAHIRKQRGDLASALMLHERALETYEELGDLRGRASAYIGIARVHMDEGDAAGALLAYRQALEILETIGDRHGRAATLGEIAEVFGDRGDIGAAQAIQKQVLQLHEELGDTRDAAAARLSLGRLAVREGRFEHALELMSSAYAALVGLGALDGISQAGLDLGRLLIALGREAEAAEILERSAEGFQRLGRADLAEGARSLLVSRQQASA